MKFTDGYWHKRDGFTVLHPSQLHDTDTDETSLTAYATIKPVATRSDTLNAPLITIRCEAPMPDVIRVTIGHFLGGVPKEPNFTIAEKPGETDADAREIGAVGERRERLQQARRRVVRELAQLA